MRTTNFNYFHIGGFFNAFLFKQRLWKLEYVHCIHLLVGYCPVKSAFLLSGGYQLHFINTRGCTTITLPNYRYLVQKKKYIFLVKRCVLTARI